MELKDVKFSLGKKVRLVTRDINAEYLFTGCILRKNERGYFYQAELQDLKNKRSVVICRLDEVIC